LILVHNFLEPGVTRINGDFRSFRIPLYSGEMMALAKQNSSRPSHAAVERFSDDLITALMGRDITTVRASVLQRAVSDLLTGRGSTFEPATKLRTTLTSCGINEPTTQAIVGRFIDIGQELRGPDDVGVQKPPLMK